MADTTSQAPSYAAMHSRINHRLGLARRRPCVDCGQPARQWSYDHSDPDELTSPTGLEYSTDPDHYQPRCRECHDKFDAKYRRSGIPRLHALARELEPQIREAVYQRNKVRKLNDVAAVDYWDTELERLTAPLRTARSERKRRAERTA